MSHDIIPLNELVNQFSRLPGIGKKTAQRLAFSILEQPPERAKKFAEALIDAREKIHFCKVCQAFTDRDICAAALRRAARPGDTILFKGSRGMHMELILDAFLAE